MDRIERETLIAAPLKRVWPLVGFWVAEEANLTATPGTATDSVVVRNSDRDDFFPIRVLKVESPTYVAFRWASAFPGEDPTEHNSTLVEFTLTQEGGKTRLRVVESGFTALAASDEVRNRAIGDNTGGWPQMLDALKVRAEKSLA